MENQIEFITREHSARLKKQLNANITRMNEVKEKHKKLEDEIFRLRLENLKHEEGQNEIIQSEGIFGSGKVSLACGEHDRIQNQTRISGEIENAQKCASTSIDEQSDSQSTNPEVDIDRSQEIDDEKEDICIGIISDPFGQQNETPPQFVVSCGLEDVLGFDPFVESAKGLLDLMREESENLPSFTAFGGALFELQLQLVAASSFPAYSLFSNEYFYGNHEKNYEN
ncbi:unnamed protein product [Caenorhabditis angaria]|uniref:Uncharacterized protein n=1 Tax=Caenorhabditis angaria TaxID=860376 RepID=A0A9P1IRG8_9PELO|nr:unnamed protein product [Caenorhabditis angaria]